MNQNPTVALIVGLATIAASLIAAALTYRASARDKRENLKRDWELIKDMPPDEFPSRAKVAQYVDKRMSELARFDQTAIHLRRTGIALALSIAGLTTINAVAAGKYWAYYTFNVVGFIVLFGTFGALGIFVYSGVNAAASWGAVAGNNMAWRVLCTPLIPVLWVIMLCAWPLHVIAESVRALLQGKRIRDADILSIWSLLHSPIDLAYGSLSAPSDPQPEAS